MLNLSRYVLLSSLICLSAVVSAQNPPTTPAVTPPVLTEAVTSEQKAEILKAVADIIDRRMYVTGIDLKKWPENLAKHQADIDKAETTRSFISEVNRAFREFGFSHLRLRSPSAARIRQEGPVAVGFGMTVEKDGDALVVRTVVSESPAAKAGIGVGDKIVECDGKLPDSPAVLSGERGTSTKLKVLKSTGQTIDLELQRQQFSTARKDTLKWTDEETAVLRVFSFSRGYDRENLEKLVGEANAKAKYLILDLRSNGGGATDSLRHLLSLLLPKDSVIGTFVSKREAERYAEANGGDASDPIKIAAFSQRKYRTVEGKVPAFAGKIAVLINRGSASASEICAAALKEVSGSPIVGGRSAGAVLASVYGKLPHGFEIQYPITDYVTVKGMRLEGNPLLPDFESVTVPVGEKDDALEKAISVLKNKP